MSNFHKKNRSFGTLDLIGLIALVGTVCSIVGIILAQAMKDDRPQRARAMAEALAKQISAEQNKAFQFAQVVDSAQKGTAGGSSSGRGPASVEPAVPALTSGSLGRDPWGQPFHYSVRKLESNNGRQVARVFVWSDGPDGKSQTDLANLKVGGDDLGYLEEFNSD